MFQSVVAQVSNLLYRSASSLRGVASAERVERVADCRLEIGDTAGWKPALQGGSMKVYRT
jgi:hypothetical protein